jgi:hypothetical protein
MNGDVKDIPNETSGEKRISAKVSSRDLEGGTITGMTTRGEKSGNPNVMLPCKAS